jgi:hypothetical protein
MSFGHASFAAPLARLRRHGAGYCHGCGHRLRHDSAGKGRLLRQLGYHRGWRDRGATRAPGVARASRPYATATLTVCSYYSYPAAITPIRPTATGTATAEQALLLSRRTGRLRSKSGAFFLRLAEGGRASKLMNDPAEAQRPRTPEPPSTPRGDRSPTSRSYRGAAGA